MTRAHALPAWSVPLAAAIAVGIGSFQLAAWFSGWAAQWSAEGMLVMKTNLSLGLVLAGVALFVLNRPRRTARDRLIAGSAAGLVSAIGSLTLIQLLFGIDLGIDQLLAREGPGAAGTLSPNRMGPPGAISVTLVGLALVAWSFERRAAVPYLGLGAAGVTLVPALGFLYGIETFYRQPQVTAIAWPAVVGLLALGCGLVMAHPRAGPMVQLLRDDPGGELVRRLLPIALLVLLVLGFLKVQAEQHGLFDTHTRTGLLVLAGMVIFSALLWHSAAGISRAAAAEREAVAALTGSERRYRELVQNANSAIIRWRCDGTLVFFNEYAESFFGYRAEEVVGQHAGLLLPPNESTRRNLSGLVQDIVDHPERYFNNVNENVCRDGRRVWFTWTNRAIRHADGRVREILAVGTDITERRQAEIALRESEHEKDVLLREIHHRVKNNLQVISSLVSLQAEALDDPVSRSFFQDIRDRVRSMALVHEKLYQAENLARVDFAEYARSLLESLWRAYGPAAGDIRLQLDLQPVLLTIDTAIPCGLLLNELATNALKHAFLGKSDGGTVSVVLKAGPEGRVQLAVSDNGVGLPPGLDWQQARSLGLQLVHMLAGQMDATVEFSNRAGAEFTVDFAG